MPSHARRLLALLAALAAGAAIGAYATASVRTTPPVVVRIPLAATNNPTGGKGRTLGLSRVVIPAGGQIALHRHPGTQVAFVSSGKLTYSVKSGGVTVMTGAAGDEQRVVRHIGAGEKSTIGAGDWIVEQPTTIHSAANDTSKPIVIYLATLFPIGSPAAIPVK